MDRPLNFFQPFGSLPELISSVPCCYEQLTFEQFKGWSTTFPYYFSTYFSVIRLAALLIKRLIKNAHYIATVQFFPENRRGNCQKLLALLDKKADRSFPLQLIDITFYSIPHSIACLQVEGWPDLWWPSSPVLQGNQLLCLFRS